MPELQTPAAPSATTTMPRLALVGMHIRGLRAIERFDLPQDGLGWRGKIPDLVLLAGINGSGKTTLLNFMASCFALARYDYSQREEKIGKAGTRVAEASEAILDFELKVEGTRPLQVRFVVGDEEYVRENRTDMSWDVIRYRSKETSHWNSSSGNIAETFSQKMIPSVVLVPSDNRSLSLPPESYKSGGKLIENHEFVHRWRPPALWKESLEAFLYSLRWEDLNAKEEGRPEEAHHFASYAEAFHRLTDERKSLVFENGQLVVRVEGSPVVHDLSELSSGERQLLVLTGELLRYWRPGSLILIDEPELHLHSRWQTRLYESLRHWQKERGGQIILATQSAHLVELAGPGTAALLGMEPL